jgi:hypothetical protein
MALLSRRWSLLDVDDVEALAWKMLGTNGQVAGLQPHQRDDLCTHVITTIWEASLRFDPDRNVSFSTYAYVIGQRSIVSWFRSTSNGFGRTRWKFGDGRIHERARPELLSLDAERDSLGAALGTIGGDSAAVWDEACRGLFAERDRERVRDLDLLGLGEVA